MSSFSSNQLENFVQRIYQILFPILFSIGLIGNLLSASIFSMSAFKKTSCSCYLFVLAMSSIFALIGGLHHCLTIGYHVFIKNGTYCRFRHFILYTSMDLASWMLVALSVDRWFRVKYPIQAKIRCTKKLSINVSIILSICLIVKNLHLATPLIGDFTVLIDDYCRPNSNYPKYVLFFEKVWPWIDLITYAALPFLIVTMTHTWILYDRYRRRLKFGQQNLDRSLMKFLLITSISYVFCNFPIAIALIVYPFISTNEDKIEFYYDTASFVLDCLRLLSYSTLAFMFYIYYYTSSLFRDEFKRLFAPLFYRFRSAIRIQTISIELKKKNSVQRDSMN